MKKIFLSLLLFAFIFSSSNFVRATDATSNESYSGIKSENYTFLKSEKVSNPNIISGLMTYKSWTYNDYEIYDKILIRDKGIINPGSKNCIIEAFNTHILSLNISQMLSDTEIRFEDVNSFIGIASLETNVDMGSVNDGVRYALTPGKILFYNYNSRFAVSDTNLVLITYSKSIKIKKHSTSCRQTGPIWNVYNVCSSTVTTEEEYVFDISYIPTTRDRITDSYIGKGTADFFLFRLNDEYRQKYESVDNDD